MAKRAEELQRSREAVSKIWRTLVGPSDSTRELLERVADTTMSPGEFLEGLVTHEKHGEFAALRAEMEAATRTLLALKAGGDSSDQPLINVLVYAYHSLHVPLCAPMCCHVTRWGLPCGNRRALVGTEHGGTIPENAYLHSCSEHRILSCAIGTSRFYLEEEGAKMLRGCLACGEMDKTDAVRCRLCSTWAHRSCITDLVADQNLPYDEAHKRTFAICAECFAQRLLEFVVVEPKFRFDKCQLLVMPPNVPATSSRIRDTLELFHSGSMAHLPTVVWIVDPRDEDQEEDEADPDAVLDAPLSNEKRSSDRLRKAKASKGTKATTPKDARTPRPKPKAKPAKDKHKDSRDPDERRARAKATFKAAHDDDSDASDRDPSSDDDDDDDDPDKDGDDSSSADDSSASSSSSSDKSSSDGDDSDDDDDDDNASRRARARKGKSKKKAPKRRKDAKKKKRKSKAKRSPSPSDSDDSDDDSSDDSDRRGNSRKAIDRRVAREVKRQLQRQPGKVPEGPSGSDVDATGKRDGWKAKSRGGPQTREAATHENYTGMGALTQQEQCVVRHMGVKRLDKLAKDRYLPENTTRTDSFQLGSQTIQVEKTGLEIPLRDTFDLWARRRGKEWRGIIRSGTGVYKKTHKHYDFYVPMAT